MFAFFLGGFCLLAAASTPTEQKIERLERRTKERPDDFIAFTMLGQEHIRHERETGDLSAYKRAASAFEVALAVFPEHAGALSGLASVRLALHSFSEGRELALKILRRDPANVDGLLLLGDAELALGNNEAAAKIFERMGNSPAVFARRAELARLRGQNDEALRLNLRAVDEAEARGDSADNISWYRVRAGEMYFRTGNFEMAGAQYDAALARWPESFLAAEHIAELRAAEEKFEEAIALYQKLIARSARPDLEQELGDVYIFVHKEAQAKPCHDKALSGYLDSVQHGEVHFIHHLAGFYADARENGGEAVKWARKDLELRRSPAAHDALAWALYRAGAFAESRDQMNEALASGIKDAHIFFHAAMIFSAAGDLEPGKKFLRETAVLNPRYKSFHVHR